MDLNNIYCGDSRELLTKLDLEVVNLIVTSPPYNVNRNYDIYQDNLPYRHYLDFLEEVFRLCYDILPDDGRVCVNIADVKCGQIPLGSDFHHIMTHNIGFRPYSHIIWNKSQVSKRTAWGSFMSPSMPTLILPFEHIFVFSKKDLKLNRKGETDILKKEFIDWTLSLWTFPPETSMRDFDHEAMFPEELPYRCIKMFSYINDVVLDPFNGAGTTTLAAMYLNRRYLGFELSEKHCKTARKRIEDYKYKHRMIL